MVILIAFKPNLDDPAVYTGRLTNIVSRFPVSILYKSISGRYRPVRVADGPITA